MSVKGMLGRKVGMTVYYKEDGSAFGITVVETGPCIVVQVKTMLRDQYEAVQLGFLPVKRATKPEVGHMSRSGGLFRYLAEFAPENLQEVEAGQTITCDIFKAGDHVKVSGKSKGRGFAGGVKRYGFKGGPKTHGQSDRLRAPGSIGASASPSRVLPGTRMAGRYGGKRSTVSGLEIVESYPERNLLFIKGAVPGHKNTLLSIEKRS